MCVIFYTIVVVGVFFFCFFGFLHCLSMLTFFKGENLLSFIMFHPEFLQNFIISAGLFLSDWELCVCVFMHDWSK